MSRRRGVINAAVAVAALALAGVLAAGCSLSRWVGVEPGEYAAEAGARGIQKLDINREQRRMVLTLDDGSEIVAAFVPRDRAAWPAGCPTNINSTRMEVLDIAEEELTIGATTFRHPVLVRDCPRDPVRLVLRADGAIGGGGGACQYPEPCIEFAPR